MKRISLLAASALAALVASTSVAQTNTNLVRALISVTCVSTNASGGLVYEHNRTSGFIENFVSGLGITTNSTNFSLVFNRTNTSLQVVNGTNQTLIGTALTFTNVLSLTNSNHTVVEFQWNVRVGTNTATTGTVTGTQRLGTNNAFLLIARLAYTEPAVGTNAPAICRGALVVTNRDIDREEDDDDDDGDHDGNNGNNGHHGEGNHGNGLGNGGPIDDQPGNGNGNGNKNNKKNGH